MKKLVFATAIALGSLTAISAATVTPQPSHNALIGSVITVGDFEEIAVADVPAAVTDALKADHAGATITKAYKNDQDQYKLEVAMTDGSTATLYADSEGKWLDM